MALAPPPQCDIDRSGWPIWRRWLYSLWEALRESGGEDGSASQWHAGAGAPSSGLGEDGDFYLDTSSGDVYERDGSWSLVANIAGPEGPAGEAGPQGAAGPAGEAGPQGEEGPEGPAGVDGADGADGANGDDGWSPVFAVASDGARRVLQVTSWTGGGGSPPSSPTYVGASGFTTNIAEAVDIRGAQGEQGPQGEPGADGEDGADGAPGEDGAGLDVSGVGIVVCTASETFTTRTITGTTNQVTVTEGDGVAGDPTISLPSSLSLEDVAADSLAIGGANAYAEIYNTHADYFYVARGNLGGIGGGFAPDTWYSIGPTGSGADKEWSALDSVPAGAPWIELFIAVSASAGVTTGLLRGRKHGSSAAGSNSNGTLATVTADVNLAQVTRKISLDANRMFDLYTNALGGVDPNIGVDAFLTGYAQPHA